MAEKVQKGDLVRFAYTGRAASTGEAFDTTDEELAKREGIHREELAFKPALVVAGAGHLLPGLDEALVGAEVGVPKKVAVPMAKGFGERKKELERLMPEREFLNRGIKPEAGLTLDFDGTPGRVISVGGGRVRVDFNPELAGQDLEYEIEVKARFSKPSEQVEALRAELLPDTKATLAESGEVRVNAPGEVAKVEAYLRAKLRFLYFTTRFVSGVKEVVFEEHYRAPALGEAEGQANV